VAVVKARSIDEVLRGSSVIVGKNKRIVWFKEKLESMFSRVETGMSLEVSWNGYAIEKQFMDTCYRGDSGILAQSKVTSN
jgi:hypothetical protein